LTPHPGAAPKAILIAGPTASGKSAAALELASRLGGTVINADSMQVYRELAVLTARPTEAEQREAPHRLFGTVSVAEAYSVGRWLADAGQAIEAAQASGSLPILVGGTGLYFKALTEGLASVPDIPAEIRNYWRERAEELGRDKLYLELVERDPGMAARLRRGDIQRLVRALEVIDATAFSLAEWQGTNATPRLDRSAVLRLVIAPEREPLYAAIGARFDRMVAEGALEEVEHLISLRLDSGLPAMRAHGVRELAAHLVGAASRDDAIAKAKTESRRYAKRQMTWARRFMADWEWVPDAASAAETIRMSVQSTRQHA
jgi:tRNA dimethylallyltransferase